MIFLSNNSEYSVVTNSEVSSVIAHFSDEMIMDILEKNMLVNRVSSMPKANLVYSLEEDFKKCLDLYPAYNKEILDKRFEIYSLIVQRISSFYGIQCKETSNQNDIHAQAFFLYSFLVSEFMQNVVNFFTNYIMKEKNALYELMDRELSTKGKDFNTLYSKKVYNNLNNKIVAIHSNLDYVVDNICAFDIDFETFIQSVFSNNVQVSNYLSMVVVENSEELFQHHIVPFVRENRSIILTYIKLSLQHMVEPEIQYYLKEEE
ncbi:MAG: hypothetical protein PHC62_00220 [Candidatus Izemoplasmatales bacterium]|nr:hypothetical protein [Candidatus Izemoplasmatales bacterium]